MRHKFDIRNILEGIVGYRGLPFNGVLLGRQPGVNDGSDYSYEVRTQAKPKQQYLKNGTPLYARDHLGRWYFMPVYFSTSMVTVELPYAVVSVKQKKIIEKTPLVERGGSVKELIATDDWEISIAGLILSSDGSYPEDEIAQIRELYARNESVEMVCALTDMLFDPQEKVVIESIDFPSTPGLENGQAVKIQCTTDKPFELIIE